MGWGGIITSKALVAFSVVDWLSDHLLVGRSQKENAADLREMLVKILSKINDFTSSSSKSDSLVHVRDCTPSWVKELPGGVAEDVIFPIRVVGLSKMGLLPVQVSNLVMATVMA